MGRPGQFFRIRPRAIFESRPERVASLERAAAEPHRPFAAEDRASPLGLGPWSRENGRLG